MDIVSWLLSRKYTDESILGIGGALAGKNCTIYSSTKSGDTTTIVFKWTADDGTERTTEIQVKDGETPTITSTEIEGGHTLTFATTDPSQTVSFNVMDGEEGQRGVSVISADVDANNYLKLTMSDGNIINAGQIKTISMVDDVMSITSPNPVQNRVITTELNKKVDKVSGKQLSTEDFTTAEKNKLANIENNAQVNTLENLIINGEEATIVDKKIALNIITSAVSNLQNYYLKSETYTKTEVEELIGSTVGVTIEIVQELPTIGQTNVIYFLPTETANVYSQYIYTANDGWVLIGSTSVDLSNYYTKGQVDTLLNGKQNVLTIDAFPTAMSNNPVASGGVYSAIAQMQPQFQFTNMPVASESNYGFVYQYIGNAGTYEPNMFYRCVYNTYAGEYRWEEVIFHATVTVDSELSSTSTNPVQNKVVKEALDTKQDIMQFVTMPSAQDNLGKIVQYTGATTSTYQNGCFYKAVYDSEHDVYIWNIVRFSADISVDNVLSDVSENPVQNKVITNKFDEYETSFTGTQDEWDALTTEQQNVYDTYNIIDDGSVLNLGIYLEKKAIMPVASEDVENKIYLYTGTTTQYYKKGVVYQCVSDGQTPASYSWVALIDFGTAATKNSTDRVSPNNTDLVESQSVYSAINTALSSIYTPRGDITCAELTSSLLISDNIGNIYEVSDSGTTTALFLQGAGHPIAVGDNVGIINAGQGRILFNLMANAFDLTDYQLKNLASTIEGATTVEGALGALSTNKQAKDLTTSVESATTVEGALSTLSTNKQPKTLATPITVGGVSQTTVESALGAINTDKQSKTLTTSVEGATTVEGALSTLNTKEKGDIQDVYKVMGQNGAKNLAKPINNIHYLDIDVVCDENGVLTVTGTASGSGGRLNIVSDSFMLKAGTYKVVHTSDDLTKYSSMVCHKKADSTSLGYSLINNGTIDNTHAQFTLESDTECFIGMNTYQGTNYGTNVGTKEYVMVVLADDTDTTYQPYTKTNQELTNQVKAKSALGCKNLLASLTPSGTYLGLTISRNDNNDIVVNGTATNSPSTISLFDNTFKHIGEASILKLTDLGIDKTKQYVFSRATKVTDLRYNLRIMNGSTQVAEIELSNGDGLYTVIDFSQYTCDGLKADLVVTNGATITNQIYSAMLCLKELYDFDPTYETWAESNSVLTQKTTRLINNVNNNGCKNLFNFNEAKYDYSGSSLVFSYGDNCLNIITGGTSGGEFTYPSATTYKKTMKNLKPNTEYVLSYGKTVISGLVLQVYYKATSSSDWARLVNDKSGVTYCRFTTPSSFDTIWVRFCVYSSGSVGTGTIYPMLCLASDYDLDSTFVPYAMSNRELTEVIPNNASSTNQLVTKNNLSYSTSETKTGTTWIDGKPIYRKVLETTLPSTSGDFSVNHNIANLGQVINQYGMTAPESRGQMRQLDFAWYNNSQWDCCMYTNATAIMVQMGSEFATYHGGHKAYIVLEYTKTTD